MPLTFETQEQLKEADTDYLKRHGVKRVGLRQTFKAEETKDGIEVCGGEAVRYYFDDKEPEELPSSRACVTMPREFFSQVKTKFDPPGEGGTPMTKEEIREIAAKTADEVMKRIGEQEENSLLLNSIPYAYGSPGIVVNEALAMASTCRCLEYRPGKKLCFTKGIIGALSDEQESVYCGKCEELESPGLKRRLEQWREAVGVCKVEIASIPKGERLGPWLSCMSRELSARGVKT